MIHSQTGLKVALTSTLILLGSLATTAKADHQSHSILPYIAVGVVASVLHHNHRSYRYTKKRRHGHSGHRYSYGHGSHGSQQRQKKHSHSHGSYAYKSKRHNRH